MIKEIEELLSRLESVFPLNRRSLPNYYKNFLVSSIPFYEDIDKLKEYIENLEKENEELKEEIEKGEKQMKYKFLGKMFIPKEKKKDFLKLKITNGYDEELCYKVKVKEYKRGRFHQRYQVKSFIDKTNEEMSNYIIYVEFLENVYGDLFLSKIDNTVGANMLYILIKLGYVYDYHDMMKFKKGGEK